MKPEQRFMNQVKVVLGDNCWLWAGSTKPYGYGYFWLNRFIRSHRLMYNWLVEPIPNGFVVHHKCGVKSCVNPSHLEAMSYKDHHARHPEVSCNRGKTHCVKGHHYSGDNLILEYREDGSFRRRSCRECIRIKNKKYQDKIKTQACTEGEKKVCSDCKGWGHKWIEAGIPNKTEPCKTCNGTGEVG